MWTVTLRVGRSHLLIRGDNICSPEEARGDEPSYRQYQCHRAAGYSRIVEDPHENDTRNLPKVMHHKYDGPVDEVTRSLRIQSYGPGIQGDAITVYLMVTRYEACNMSRSTECRKVNIFIRRNITVEGWKKVMWKSNQDHVEIKDRQNKIHITDGQWKKSRFI